MKGAYFILGMGLISCFHVLLSTLLEVPVSPTCYSSNYCDSTYSDPIVNHELKSDPFGTQI